MNELTDSSNISSDEKTLESSSILASSDNNDQAMDNNNDEDINVEGVDVIKHCLCVQCGEGNGITRMMIHKIPFFRELVIASFHCPDCNETNNEVTYGGSYQPQGQRTTLKVINSKDLDRQLIKSDSATLRIEELDFEIPSTTQKGVINTIEGFLSTAAKNLGYYQKERMIENPSVGMKVNEVIMKLNQILLGSDDMYPFHLILDDPSGNSYVQNIHAPNADPNIMISYYDRTPEQNQQLGISTGGSQYRDDGDTNFTELLSHQFGSKSAPDDANNYQPSECLDSTQSTMVSRSEVITIPSECPNCMKWGDSRTAVTDIPHFKQILIMAFTCNYCGFRNNEVKGGGAVPDRGTEVQLVVTSGDDMKRDVLKSDSCQVKIPELDLELQHGTLGGLYTTVEGLLKKIHSSLALDNPFVMGGDSATLHHSASSEYIETTGKFQSFLNRLNDYSQGKHFPFTVILRDPLGNSFISAPLGSFLPPELDQNLTLSEYDRSYEENEDFGLNDMNTKDFESGVDASTYYSHILPDRLTHITVKGADHPTFYAKGTDDSTPGGAVVRGEDSYSKQDARNNEADASYFQGPAGWTFSRVPGDRFIVERDTENSEAVDGAEAYAPPILPDNYGKRIFNATRDYALKFLPYEEWSGRKEGFVFRLGARGLGYYEDKPMTEEEYRLQNDPGSVEQSN